MHVHTNKFYLSTLWLAFDRQLFFIIAIACSRLALASVHIAHYLSIARGRPSLLPVAVARVCQADWPVFLLPMTTPVIILCRNGLYINAGMIGMILHTKDSPQEAWLAKLSIKGPYIKLFTIGGL